MTPTTDCLIIGHNDMDFAGYVDRVGKMGLDSGAYRDLDKNFITIGGRPYHAADVFNILMNTSSHSRSAFPPLNIGESFHAAVAYLGTYLSRRGLTFDYVLSFQEEKESLRQKLAGGNILAIAVTTTLYTCAFPIYEIMEFLNRYNRGARIIIGGPFVAGQVRGLEADELEYLFTTIGADFYVDSSQGETALAGIIDALKSGSPVDRVKNIFYRSAGCYTATPAAPENNRLAENMVDWNLFAQRLGAFVNVRTSISCPFACAFCGFPQHAGRYQTAGVEEVERELDTLREIGGVESVQFIDDTFNVPPRRFKEILRRVIKNRYPFKWHAHFRCQYTDREMVELMRESGCEGVFLGIESGDDGILKNMNKATSVEAYLEGIALLREYGIPVFGSFIIGFPGESEETVRRTRQFINDSQLDFYRAQLWYCDPITPIWKERETYAVEGSRFQWRHRQMDCSRACDLIDDLFLSIDRSIWIPQYNFEFNGIFHLLHRGFSMERIKGFLKIFNRAVAQKLRNPHSHEAGSGILEAMRRSLTGENGLDDDTPGSGAGETGLEAEFDF